MSHLGQVLTGTAVLQAGRAGWQRQKWSHFAESSGLRVRWPMSIPVSMASSKLITTQGDSTYSESSVRCQLTVCLLSLGYREGTVHQRKDNPERASTNPLPPRSSTVCLWTSPGKGELGTAWWVDAPPSRGPPLWAGWRGPRTRNEGWLDTTLPFWRPPDPSVLPMVCLYYLDNWEDLSPLLPKVFRWEFLNQKERERERENGYRSQAMCPFCHLTPSTTAQPGLLSEGLQGHCPPWLFPEPLFHRYCYYFSSIQSLSCVRLFATPWTIACQASLSITNFRSLPKLMSIESVMPSNHLILCHPLLLLPSIFPNIRVFSNESALHIRWPKYWSFRFSISPSNEYSGLISFRIDWFDLPAVYTMKYQSLQHWKLFLRITVSRSENFF